MTKYNDEIFLERITLLKTSNGWIDGSKDEAYNMKKLGITNPEDLPRWNTLGDDATRLTDKQRETERIASVDLERLKKIFGNAIDYGDGFSPAADYEKSQQKTNIRKDNIENENKKADIDKSADIITEDLSRYSDMFGKYPSKLLTPDEEKKLYDDAQSDIITKYSQDQIKVVEEKNKSDAVKRNKIDETKKNLDKSQKSKATVTTVSAGKITDSKGNISDNKLRTQLKLYTRILNNLKSIPLEKRSQLQKERIQLYQTQIGIVKQQLK